MCVCVWRCGWDGRLRFINISCNADKMFVFIIIIHIVQRRTREGRVCVCVLFLSLLSSGPFGNYIRTVGNFWGRSRPFVTQAPFKIFPYSLASKETSACTVVTVTMVTWWCAIVPGGKHTGVEELLRRRSWLLGNAQPIHCATRNTDPYPYPLTASPQNVSRPP